MRAVSRASKENHSNEYNSVVAAVRANDEKKVTAYYYKHGGVKGGVFKQGMSTLLHVAATNSTPTMTQLLLSLGAKVDSRNSVADTPLTWACAKGEFNNGRSLKNSCHQMPETRAIRPTE